MNHKTRGVTIVSCALVLGVIGVRSGQAPHDIKNLVTRPNPRLLDTYARLPLAFEPNRGQTDPRVKFLSRGKGYTLFLTSTEAVIGFGQESDTAALRMTLVAGRTGPVISGLDQLPGKSNEFWSLPIAISAS